MIINRECSENKLKILEEKKDNQYLVSFAEETENVIENSLQKLNQKHLDAIVINDVSKADAGFDVDTNAVTFIRQDGTREELPLAEKTNIAKALVQLIIQELEEH